MSFWVRNDRIHKWTIGIPILMLYLGLVMTPIIYTIIFSFVQKDSIKRKSTEQIFLNQDLNNKDEAVENKTLYHFSLKGYRNTIEDDEYIKRVRNTVIFTILCVIGQLLLGLLCALIIEKAIFLKVNTYLFLIAFFLPYAVPTSIVVLMWDFILLKDGIFAQTMTLLGIRPEIWKTDMLFESLIFISIWEYFPFVFLAIYARIRKINKSIYLTAMLDGASSIKIFQKITLPILKDSLIVIVLLRIAFMFSKYDLPLMFAEYNSNDEVRLVATYFGKNVGTNLLMINQFSMAVVSALIVLVMTFAIYGLIYLPVWIRQNKKIIDLF